MTIIYKKNYKFQASWPPLLLLAIFLDNDDEDIDQVRWVPSWPTHPFVSSLDYKGRMLEDKGPDLLNLLK